MGMVSNVRGDIASHSQRSRRASGRNPRACRKCTGSQVLQGLDRGGRVVIDMSASLLRVVAAPAQNQRINGYGKINIYPLQPRIQELNQIY